MANRIQLRRGTAAEWTAANPVLGDGEPGVEKDTGKVKYGNGVAAWSALPYASAGPQGPAGVADDTSVADLVTTPGSETATALSATYGTTTGAKPVGKGELVLDVRDFGAKVDNSTDDTAAFQAALDAAGTSGQSTVVHIPKGTLRFTTITVPERVTIRGCGKESTTLQVITGNASFGAVNLAPGYSDNVFFEDFKLRGAGTGNPGQHGLYMACTSKPGANPDSAGWGNGGARRIEVSNFTGHAFWLRGKGDGAYPYHQHQFLTFELCDFVPRDSISNGMLMSGKCGQVTFTNCQFNYSGGSMSTPGTNLRIIREVADDGVTNIGGGYAYAITFYTCSIEGRAKGVLIERAESVAFFNPFFERLGYAFEATTATRNIALYAPHFANAAVADAGDGYLVKAQTPVSIYNANVAGTAQKTFVNLADVYGLTQPSTGMVSSNVTMTTSPASGAISIQSAKTVLTSGTVHTITTGNHAVGSVVSVKAYGGDLSLTTSGNLSLAGNASPLVLTGGRVATFMLMDTVAPGIWQMISISAPTGVALSRTVTANTTLTTADDIVVSNGTDLTITLPDPTTVSIGKIFRVKNINATAATVVSAGSFKQIDGAASHSLAQWAAGRYSSDGVRWLTI